jgi:hypothetical protein
MLLDEFSDLSSVPARSLQLGDALEKVSEADTAEGLRP